MTFLAPSFLALLAIAAPILLLWFLRQRRDPLEVPTIFLWRRASEEERVSPMLRRLEKSILLFLELAALALIAAAAADLVFRVSISSGARRVALVVDRSASMSATDAAGVRRIDAARERAETLLDTLRSGDRAMLVAFDSEARVLSGLTEDVGGLRRALAAIEPTDRPTDLAAALAALSAAAGDGNPEVFLFSDGAFAEVPHPPANLAASTFRFVPAGSAADNVGIVGLDLSAGLELSPRAFVRVSNASERPAARTVSLRRDGAVLAAVEISAAPHAGAGATFDLSAFGTGEYEVRLEPFDSLAADDCAYFVLREEPLRKILAVTAGNPEIDRLREVHPRVEIYTIAADQFAAAAPEGFDLFLVDGALPPGPLPPRPAVFLDCAPPGRGVYLSPPVANPDLVDFPRDARLNRDVDWSEVLFARASPIAEETPGRLIILAESAAGPLAAEIAGEPFAVVLGFKLADSNLTLRLAWPILFGNILDRAFRSAPGGGGACSATGSVLTCALPPGVTSAQVLTPAGAGVDLPALPDGTVAFADTARAGFYRFTFGAGAAQTAAASLLSSVETDCAPRAEVVIGGAAHPADSAAVEASLPIRRPLVLLALLALVAEWLLFAFTRR